MRETVTLVAQTRWGEIAGACPQGHQGLTRLIGEEACQLVVRDHGFVELSGMGLPGPAPRRSAAAPVPHLRTPRLIPTVTASGPAPGGHLATTANDSLPRFRTHPPK